MNLLPYDVLSLRWNILHTQNEEHIYCYCGKNRDIREIELQCESCHNWFHAKCIHIELGPIVPFVTNYIFICIICNTKNQEHAVTEETFLRTENTWPGICITALANLIMQNLETSSTSKIYFKKNDHLKPFVDLNWSGICTGRVRTATWWATLGSCLYQHPELFVCEDEAKRSTSLGFTLKSQNLFDIIPNYGCMKEAVKNIPESVHLREIPPPEMIDVKRSERNEKRSNTDMNRSMFATNDHPFNKDGFRYILSERDPFSNVSFRQKDILAGIYISREDRSPFILVSMDRLTATTEKGFRLARASESVLDGAWYFEVLIHPELPDEAHCRIGWSRQEASLQAPVGYDSFGYAYRDKTGDKVHCGRTIPYANKFGPGDVIGVYINLKQSLLPFQVGKRRERFLCTFRNQLYFEEKEHTTIDPAISPNSTISFSKNGIFQGIAFNDIFEGPYYPSLSLYRGCRVSVNFGPIFKYPPLMDIFTTTTIVNPYSNRYAESAVMNILQDAVDTIEMELFQSTRSQK